MKELRKNLAAIVVLCTIIAGCSAISCTLVGCGATTATATPATASTATTTAETATPATATTAATTAETATPATATTTAETATPATAAQAETTPIHYIVVYDDGTEVSLYVEGDEVYFFEGGGRTKKDNIPGLSNLPKVSGRVKRSEIGDADLLDYIKENAY